MSIRRTVAAVLTLATATAHAQWTVTNLHVAGYSRSQAAGTDLGNHVGTVNTGTIQFASLWSGPTATWTNLTPAGASQSRANDVFLGVQVGRSVFSGFGRAGLWNGSAATWTDLHPAQAPNISQSEAYGVASAQQVGVATFTTATPQIQQRASLWSGTASSWVDLHPPLATDSIAYDTSGSLQVGSALFATGATRRASLWNGSAASWIDLSPAGATLSEAVAIDGGRQAGNATIGSVTNVSFASLWSGTAASWINLHPAGATTSGAVDIFGDYQVGYATVGGVQRASLWNGTAASWEDLSLALTGSWGTTRAQGVWADGSHLYVVGFGRNLTTARDEALLWTRPLGSGCAADLNNDEAVDINDLLLFLLAFESGAAAADLDDGTSTGTPDNAVDINDLLFFLARFEAGC